MAREVVLLAVLLLGGCDAVGAASAAPAAPYLLTASGRIDARSEARTLVAELDGIIAAVFVERDAAVRAGQPIMRLACADRHAALMVARAEAAAADARARLVAAGPRHEDRDVANARADEARADLRDAHDALARAEALLARGFVSKRRLEELAASETARRARLAAAEADVAIKKAGSRRDERAAADALAAAARAGIAAQAAMVDKCTLRSPIDGVVLQLLKREGEFSAGSSGAPVAVVANLDAIIVRAEIIETDAARAAIGQSVDVWIDGDKRRWSGTITGIAGLMGRRTARSLDPSDRFDRDVREAIIGFSGAQPPAIVGLRVNIGVKA